MRVKSLVTRLARLRSWQAPIQRGQDATVSTQTWVPDGLVMIYSYFPLLRKLFIQELGGEEYFYLRSHEYESSVDVMKTHVPTLICALKWTVNSSMHQADKKVSLVFQRWMRKRHLFTLHELKYHINWGCQCPVGSRGQKQSVVSEIKYLVLR
jgi:hypothetical protein